MPLRLSMVLILLFPLVFLASTNNRASDAADAKPPNVVFIAVDDLNHWVGHLGRNPQTKTPNIDRLAKLGTTFTRAYCAAPICNPSRTSLLSGKRPSTSGVYDNNDSYELGVTASDSLVMQFKKGGYETLGMGKLWHGGLGFPSQWSSTGGKERNQNGKLKLDRSIGPIKFGVLEGGDETVSDTQIADYGIAELSKRHDQPFFLTFGFHKPHMPWNVPQEYYDKFPLESIELPAVKEDDLADIPPAGVKIAHAFGDHSRVVASGRWKEAVQAYLATINYLDGQVGRVLDALEKSPERDNTIVVFWGDHGWHLGEKEHWRKFALWEESTRAPLIWIAPGVTQPGTRCDRTVDFMSIYPTLCELAKLPKPTHVEGKSIVGLLAKPNMEWSDPAITTYGLNNHAVRTERWRYIRYANGDEELYDHAIDDMEWTNLASKKELEPIKKELANWFPKVNNPAVNPKEPNPKKKNNNEELK